MKNNKLDVVKKMKYSSQVIGLPIISIAEGEEIGIVKSLVVNPEKGSVDFLTIEHEDWQVSVKAIPFKKVIGIGEYAVTVEHGNAVIDLNEIPIANQLVNKKIKIIHAKVMTRKGELLGEVTEYYLDEENGHINGMTIKTPSNEVVLPAEQVLTFGRDIIVVKEDAPFHYVNDASDLIHTTDVEVAASADVEITGMISELEVEEALKEKQVEILYGKTVSKDIFDRNGNMLFAKGTILTKEDILKAQQEGPSVMVELSMNVDA